MSEFSKVQDYSFEALKDDNREVVKHGSVLSIIGYVLDENGAIMSIALTATKPITKKGSTIYLLENSVDEKPLLSRVKQILLEEGISITSDEVEYLGEMVPSDKDLTMHYVYAVNFSDQKIESEKIKLYPLSKILKAKEAVVQASFMRLFFHLYRTQITDGNSKQKAEKADGQADGFAKAKE